MSREFALSALLIFAALHAAAPARADDVVEVPADGTLPGNPSVRMRSNEAPTMTALPESSDASAQIPGKPGVSCAAKESGRSSRAYGKLTLPFTTARVAVAKLGPASTAKQTPVTSYPYRATGKLKRLGSEEHWCTASLVKPGVLLTAAHCVVEFGGGTASIDRNLSFRPAVYSKRNPAAAYGEYAIKSLILPQSYVDGTDRMSSGGSADNDIALIVLKPRDGKRAGDVVGTYCYAWNGYSFVNGDKSDSAESLHVRGALVTELGYPAALDEGWQMERTDSIGLYAVDEGVPQTVIGSGQAKGSSGGPWFVNFGVPARITDPSDATRGIDPKMAIIGVTSGGNPRYNFQAASFFGQNREYPKVDYGGYGAGNIGRLMQRACTSNPDACEP